MATTRVIHSSAVVMDSCRQGPPLWQHRQPPAVSGVVLPKLIQTTRSAVLMGCICTVDTLNDAAAAAAAAARDQARCAAKTPAGGEDNLLITRTLYLDTISIQLSVVRLHCWRLTERDWGLSASRKQSYSILETRHNLANETPQQLRQSFCLWLL